MTASAAIGVISVQVLNDVAAVCLSKHQDPWEEGRRRAASGEGGLRFAPSD